MNLRTVDLQNALATAKIFVDGDWVESKDQDPNGDVRLIQLADVGVGEFVDKSSRFLTSAKAEELRCTFLKAGDVLVARMPYPIGRACIFPGVANKSVTVVDVCIIRPNAKILDPRWLMHCLNSPAARARIAQRATGTTRSRISRSNLGRVQIPFLAIEEQRRIAQVLDCVNALHTKRRTAIALLDDLTQSIFYNMFDQASAKIDRRSLGEVCKRITDGTHQSPRWSDTGHPFLFVSNITSSSIDFNSSKFISDETYRELTRRCPIEIGDVLYSTVGSYGIPAVVETDRKFSFQRHIAHIKPDTTILNPYFLWAALRSTNVRKQADRTARGVAQKTLNLSEIAKFTIPVPSMSSQEIFVSRLKAVKAQQALFRSHLIQLKALSASLQHLAFREELWADRPAT